PYRPAHFNAGLVQPEFRLGRAVSVAKELVCVQSVVTKEVEGRAVKSVRAAAGRNRYGSAAVAPLLCCRIVGRDLVLLNVVRAEPVFIRRGGGCLRLVGLCVVECEV